MVKVSGQRKKVVIVGGGITGLSAAYKMQQIAREQGYLLDLVLIEGKSQLGGKIQTVKRDGFVIERGPDSFLIRKKSMTELAKAVGVGDELVKNATGQAYIWLNQELYPIPAGSVMGIPTQLRPFMRTGLFSVVGKLRAMGDLVLPKTKSEGDQSLGHFFKRRLGNEVVENLIEPLLSGVYAGDIDQMSLQSTYPQFSVVEKNHRSLIKGMRKTATNQAPGRNGANVKKEGVFYSFKNGLDTLVTAIEEQLDDIEILKSTFVEAIDQKDEQTVLTVDDGLKIEADAVILTTGHEVARRLFQPYSVLQQLGNIPTTSVATIALAFPEDAISQKEQGTGFLVARKSGLSITACTWLHRKWPMTTPKGKVLLRAFVGKVGDDAIVDLPDADIERIVLEELSQIMDIKAEPDFSIVTRWKEDRPQYRVGHKELVREAKEQLKAVFPTVWLAGASYEGVGLPDCVDQGEEAAVEVLAQLFK